MECKKVSFGPNTWFMVCDDQEIIETRNSSYWMRIGMQSYLWGIKMKKLHKKIKWVFEEDHREFVYNYRFMEKNSNVNFSFFIGIN